MESLQKRPIRLPPPSSQVTTAPLPGSATTTRPLSDIREITEPSLVDIGPAVKRRSFHAGPSPREQLDRQNSRASSLKRHGSLRRDCSVRIAEPGSRSSKPSHKRSKTHLDGSSSYSSTPERCSIYNIPVSSIPGRSSSNGHAKDAAHHRRRPSVRYAPESLHRVLTSDPDPTQYHLAPGSTITNRGQGRSPVKEAGMRHDPITADLAREIPSRTFVRPTTAVDILEFPSCQHPRVKLELHVSAPLFVGGGSVEGFAKITVDDNARLRHRRALDMGAVSVDLIGFEELGPNKKAQFLCLGTDLIDSEHPPPNNMVTASRTPSSSEALWPLSPSVSALPFMISLPLDTGPPPFRSKHASIRFLLAATIQLKDTARYYRVRTSQDIHVLSTYDPERALTSLPSPLTAADELHLPRSRILETLKLNAGIHRQVWVSGASLFVDVYILNRSRRAVKRLELTLERDILCYKHAAASTLEKSASQARIFQSNEQTILARTTLKQGIGGWAGVQAYTSETRTCELEVPRGHATVKCGKYFEVRYFLNITASISNSKLVSVQLPIILIHMNSLDVLPNSVAQVAAAIEEKRAHHHRQRSRSRPPAHRAFHRSMSSSARDRDVRRRPSYTQGRAFAAPREQSLDRANRARADINELADTLDSSPRKYGSQFLHGTAKKVGSKISLVALSVGAESNGAKSSSSVLDGMAYRTPPSNRKGRTFDDSSDGRLQSFRDRLRRMRSHDTMRSNRSGRSESRSRSLARQKDQNVDPRQQLILPHVLGLSTLTQDGNRRLDAVGTSNAAEPSRPATGMIVRSQIEIPRAQGWPRKKVSAGLLKEKGTKLWNRARSSTRNEEDMARRGGDGSGTGRDLDKERQGWI